MREKETRGVLHDYLSIVSAMSTGTQTEKFDSLYSHLLSFRPPLLHPPKPKDTSLTDRISSLRLHPAIEAGLHILNYDLPSAHFLLRKMQSLPAQEGMFLHGVLHRIEGDYPNARAWYSDMSDTDIMAYVWGQKGEGTEGGKACGFVYDVEKLDQRVKQGVKDVRVEKEQERLEEESKRELAMIMDYCRQRIGLDEWEDARGAYVENSEKIKTAGQGQTTGTETRTF